MVKENIPDNMSFAFFSIAFKKVFFFQSMNFNGIFKPIAYFLNIKILNENFYVYSIIRFTQSKQIIGNHIPQH